jgi:hypothetical protein
LLSLLLLLLLLLLLGYSILLASKLCHSRCMCSLSGSHGLRLALKLLQLHLSLPHCQLPLLLL